MQTEREREDTNQNNIKRSVSTSSILRLLLLLLMFVTILNDPIVTIIMIPSINLSRIFSLFPLPVPLLNSGTPLLTAISNWTALPPSSRASTSTATSSSPMSSANAPVFPATALIIMIPVMILPAMATMGLLLMAPMPVRTPASAMPAVVMPPKQLAPQFPEVNQPLKEFKLQVGWTELCSMITNHNTNIRKRKTLPADSFQVHKVAIATTVASILLILPASGLTEVRHRREVHNNWPACTYKKLMFEKMQLTDTLRSQHSR